MKRYFYTLLLLAPLLGSCTRSVVRPLSMDREMASPRYLTALTDTTATSTAASLR
ncbi:hypothetical protein [Hymenobacter sp. DG25B]|uniref:hypothetical protein n=1 Tax=Hymenobacter sp. DG25B TaxID=1385664 RepID=UPI0012E050C0|nr:hypothetical protein [Hymenobacter sp. DG25B]